MSTDTWPKNSGKAVALSSVMDCWTRVLEQGATGLTISGGEPSEQPGALKQLIVEARQISDSYSRREGSPTADILVYTGLEIEEFFNRVEIGPGQIDVLVTGRYLASQPTKLLWRGSANQILHRLTGLATERYRKSIDDEPPARSPMQVVVGADAIWLVGIPEVGDLARLHKRLGRAGIVSQSSTWRPT
jgi:anaerobic ribonucleoside-triphosphate reductase activating protein